MAAGLDGYECGMGIGEQANVRSFITTRKPREKEGPSFAAQGIYIPALRRSVPPKVARVLLEDRRLRGRMICDSVRCCPHGAATKANEILATTGLPNRIKTEGYVALEQVAEFLRTRGADSVRDSA